MAHVVEPRIAWPTPAASINIYCAECCPVHGHKHDPFPEDGPSTLKGEQGVLF